MVIEFDSVSKHYRVPVHARELWRNALFGARKEICPVLTDFNLRIGPGERVVLCGANGRGKTTVLKLASGFVHPQRGEVRLFGKSSRKPPSQRIGLMLSTRLLYEDLSGYQNLQYSAHLNGNRDWKQRIDEARETWGLGAFLQAPVRTYSMGRRALLALARATLNRPDILLLDEPTSYLDAANSALLVEYLARTPSTVLLTTQDAPRFAPIATQEVRL